MFVIPPIAKCSTVGAPGNLNGKGKDNGNSVNLNGKGKNNGVNLNGKGNGKSVMQGLFAALRMTSEERRE